MGRETEDKEIETKNWVRGQGDKTLEIGDMRQDTGDRRRETGTEDMGQGTGDN